LRAKLKGTESERAWALRLMEDASHAAPGAGEVFQRFAEKELPRLASSEKSALVRVTLASLLQKLPLARRPALAQALLSHVEDAEDHNLPLMVWYGIEPLATNDARFVDLVAKARIPRVQRLAARRLAEDIDGIAFAGADKIAQQMGVALDAPSRLDAGLRHALWKAQGEGHVVPTKPERIADGDVDGAGTGSVGHIVEVAFGIGSVQIDGRREEIVLNSEDTDDRLDGTCSTDQVTELRLG
jgi:hypothetical protein